MTDHRIKDLSATVTLKIMARGPVCEPGTVTTSRIAATVATVDEILTDLGPSVTAAFPVRVQARYAGSEVRRVRNEPVRPDGTTVITVTLEADLELRWRGLEMHRDRVVEDLIRHVAARAGAELPTWTIASANRKASADPRGRTAPT